MKKPLQTILLFALTAAMLSLNACGNTENSEKEVTTKSKTQGAGQMYSQPLSESNIEELLSDYTVPEWYRDAKFGIFIHYGVYSVPAYGDEWYPKWMYIPGGTTWGGTPVYEYNKETYGDVSQGEGYGYKQFIPAFAEGLKSFDENNMAEQWAKLFSEAGAKYVMPVGIHHDGYALYDSDVQVTYNSVNNAGMDYIAQLKEAVTKNGMKFGISNHFAENDGYFDEDLAPEGADIKETDNTPDELYGDGQLNSDWHIRKWYDISMEIINKYQPDIIYYDYGINYAPYDNLEDANRYLMLANFYNQAKVTNPDGAVCNYKEGGFLPSEAVFNKERSSLAQINPIPFQTDTSIGTKSWGYTQDEVFRSSEDCIKALIDVVSKNGNLLLNVGPMADGTIPDEAVKTLKAIGEWLDTYGDAIYATRPWVTFGEGPTGLSYDSYSFTDKDIRFTRSKDSTSLYAIVMAAPQSAEVTISTLSTAKFEQEIESVSLIDGSKREKLDFEQTAYGLVVSLPKNYEKDLTGPFAMEIKAANGEKITTVATSASTGFSTNNYAYSQGVSVTACPDDGTDMIVSESGTDAYATYNIYCGQSVPENLTARFSGSSSGKVEVLLGGTDGVKVGEIALSPSEDGKYRDEELVIDLSSISESSFKLTFLLDGDIEFTSFSLISRNPGDTIEAESYNEKQGSVTAETTKDDHGDMNLGYVVAGDWVKYSGVNFGDGVSAFTMRHASQQNSVAEVRIDSIDGPIIVSANAAGNGSWDSYITDSFAVETVDGEAVTGTHDVYIKFNSVFNLNWFRFDK